MIARRIAVFVGAALLSAGVSTLASATQFIGAYGMPSRLAQYAGYGYGPGHHVPIVRTPAQHPERVHRMAIAPRCQGPLYPEAYAPIGCFGPNCQAAAPMMYGPVPTPAVNGVAGPAYLMAPPQQLFAPPAPTLAPPAPAATTAVAPLLR